MNTSSRMESTGKKGRIQVTETFYQRVSGSYDFEQSSVEAKGKGVMKTYLLGEKYYQNPSLSSPPHEISINMRSTPDQQGTQPLSNYLLKQVSASHASISEHLTMETLHDITHDMERHETQSSTTSETSSKLSHHPLISPQSPVDESLELLSLKPSKNSLDNADK